VQQARPVDRQLGVDHQPQVGQVQPPRRHVRRHAHPRPAVAQRLQRVGALRLAELARQRHRREPALDQPRVQVAHRLARGAEHQRAARLEEAQHIDDRVLHLARGHAHGAVVDVAVGLVAARGVDPHRVALVALGERGDVARDGGREQQGAPPSGEASRMNSRSSRKPRSSISSPRRAPPP
jgi:hypothetical protein